MANKWMIAAVTAALFSGADWLGATRHDAAPQVAAPALSAPATQQPLAASRDDEAANREESRKAHS